MLRHSVSWAIHYVDDFFTIGRPDLVECIENITIMHQTCVEAGLPLEPSKTQGPLRTITFLGIELDSISMEMRLPQDKLAHAIDMFLHRRAGRKRDFLSLIGTLAHASKVIRSSRIFLRRLIDLSTTVAKPDHFLRLNQEAKSDIEWWFQFMKRWNGISMLPLPLKPSSTVTSDASGSWGCGAFSGPEWFHLPWTGMLADSHISIKELTPVVIAVTIWGKTWRSHTVQVLSDNSATLAAINNQTSSISESAHLLRCLAFLTAHYQCELVAKHIPGRHNTLADALSRNNLMLFRYLHPQALPCPTPLPAELLDLLIIEQPDWTSQRWTDLWSATLMQV